jgi:hypothetical protein
MNSLKRLIWGMLILITSFLGGIFSNIFFAPKMAIAQAGQTLSAERLYFTGPDQRNGGQVYFIDGSGAIISLNADDEKQRIQIGTYNGAGEKGLPFIGLSDNKGDLRLLFRLAGSNESPVLIFKDRQHRDRMVMGLGLNDSGEEPFIAYFDKSGNKQMLMGSY